MRSLRAMQGWRWRREPGWRSSARWLLLAATLVFGSLFALSAAAMIEVAPAARHVMRLDRGRLNFETRQNPGRTGVRARVDWTGVEWAPDYHFYTNWFFVRIPLWIPTVLCGLGAGALWAWRLFGVTPGSCARCGYSLHGLDAGADGVVVCPECGERDAFESVDGAAVTSSG